MSPSSEAPAASCAVCFAENEATAVAQGRIRRGEGGVDSAVTVVLGTPVCGVHAWAIVTALVMRLDRSNQFYIFDGYRAENRFARHKREQNARERVAGDPQ